MRGTAAALGVGVWLAARAAFAGEPAAAAQAAKASAVPRDGAVAFTYSRADGVTGCSQQDEAAVRFLLAGVMRVEPFVPAGKSAPLTLVARVTRAQDGVIRAALEMQDAGGASKGSTFEEDATCDGAHMKLAVSIALLLQPQPAGATTATATATGATATTATATATGATAPATAAVATAPAIVQPVCKIPLGGYCLVVDIYSFALSAGGVLSLNFTADPGGGAWLNTEIRPIEEFSVGLELRGIFPSRVVAAEPADPDKPYGTPKEPMVSNATVMLTPCARYWWLMGCGVVHFGFSIAQTPAGFSGWPVVGAGPRIGIEIPFAKRFFARVHGDAVFNFTETDLILDDVNLQWKQSIFSAFVGAGLGVTFR